MQGHYDRIGHDDPRRLARIYLPAEWETFLNQGTISAETSGNVIGIYGDYNATATFANEGLLSATNGGSTEFDHKAIWSNEAAGSMVVEDGSNLTLSGPGGNDGSISLDGAGALTVGYFLECLDERRHRWRSPAAARRAAGHLDQRRTR